MRPTMRRRTASRRCAVTTTTRGGVAQTVFSDKSDVFFTAGPTATPCAAIQFVNDGQYYFQVTDLSGRELLSSDPVSERIVTVHNGVLTTYNGHTHETDNAEISENAAPGEESEVAPVHGPCGALSVGLAPFRDAGSRDASYLLWLTPIARFSGEPTQIDPVCGDGCFHGFRPEFSVTSAFRVEDKRFCEDSFCVSGLKFEDRNGNGVRDSGEPGLTGVEIRAEGDSGARLRGLTGADGAFQVCGLTHAEEFRITESVPFGYRQTAPLDDRLSRRLIAVDLGYFVDACDANFSGLDFGNQLIPNAIGGIKFEDLNANGVRDPGEPGLAGFTISLSSPSPGSPPVQTAVTDESGAFTLRDLPEGTYEIVAWQESSRTGLDDTAQTVQVGAGATPLTFTLDVAAARARPATGRSCAAYRLRHYAARFARHRALVPRAPRSST